jgi:glycosyltransferase involved in cell wall biosynthesis
MRKPRGLRDAHGWRWTRTTFFSFFGYVDITKGVETLLQAVQLVTKHADNVRLIMIGGGRGTTKTPFEQRRRSLASYEHHIQSLSERLSITEK